MIYKKFFFFFLLLFYTALSYSQYFEDLKRYVDENYSGTARYNSMGGAFGSLGGEFSSISDNPASGAVFNYTQIGFSLKLNTKKNSVFYNNTNTMNEFNDFDFNQFGIVFVLNNDSSSWSKLNFSFNYQLQNIYNDKFSAKGSSNIGIDNYFLNYAQGIELSNLRLNDNENISGLYQFLGSSPNLGFGAQQAFLGYQGYIVNPTSNTDNNNVYFSNAKYSDNLNQELYLNSSGDNKKSSFNVSGFYKNKFYVGLNINSYEINFSETREFIENNYDFESNVRSLQLRNDLKTFGKGTSIQIGLIALLKNNFRLGISYHSPIWYKFFEESSQYLISSHKIDEIFYEDTIDPNTINVYPEYKLSIPSKLSASISYVFNKKGIISFEFTSQNISSTNFSNNISNSFTDLNNEVNISSKTKTTIKTGLEYRLYDSISLRGGFFNQSSYVKSYDNGLSALSFGIGFNFGYSFLDISIQKFNLKDSKKIFNSALNNNFSIKKESTRIVATYNINL